MLKKLIVDLGERSYPIFIADGALASPELWQDCLVKRGKVVIVTNETVQKWYLEPLKNALKSIGVDALSCILPDGEQYKDLEHFNDILTFLLENSAGRDSTIFALGGGVIGDMSGFAAACYQRGIDFIQVPTTLLSYVDSSVGGKTAVNHPLGKNMIGAFYQPKAVIIDLNTLKTLPEREIAAGMAEVIKYGIIWDPEFFQYLENNSDKIWAQDLETLSHVVYRCCEIKAEVVHQDETEGGLRAILNLGHTFGHAIETFMGYGVWLHGEGVAAGMVMAARLALKRGKISAADFERIRALIAKNRLPVSRPESMPGEAFLKLMIHDKKNRQGHINYIIPDSLGHVSLYRDVTDAEALEAVG